MKGNNFAQMYMAQLVQACLHAAVRQEGKQLSKVDMDTLKDMSMDIAGTLYYLVMMAKTRTRNEIMKSRKALSVDAYGQ